MTSVSVMVPPPVLLSIAGFDPSSGAGVTADLQVFAAHGMFGTAAITALTVQSTRRVAGVRPVAPEILRATLAELHGDLPPAGIKIGMLGSADLVETVAEFLARLPARPVVVLDPVLRSSSGRALLEPEALGVLTARLLPLVDWITPNWSELAELSGLEVRDEAGVQEALEQLGVGYPQLAIVATGGELAEPVDLVFLPDGRVLRVPGEHVETTSTHGTGCAFSSALLCELVAGAERGEAVRAAKRFVEGALRHAPGLGGGRGPMDFLWPLRRSRSRGARSDRRLEVL